MIPLLLQVLTLHLRPLVPWFLHLQLGNGMLLHHLIMGQRPGMEDFFTISENERFFAIFDGHGGRQVSKYCEMKAIPYLEV